MWGLCDLRSLRRDAQSCWRSDWDSRDLSAGGDVPGDPRESLATAWRSQGDESIVLFLKLRAEEKLDARLVDAIRQRLKSRCSPRHVPAYIVQAPDLPRTMSGKLSEIAVRSALAGQKLGNDAALANPESLKFFREWKPTP